MQRADRFTEKPPPSQPRPLISAAKITRPSTSGSLPRPRLFRLLNDSIAKAVWISGPPGSGKTILASSYAESSKRLCIWLRLDQTDADPASFFLNLTHAAECSGLSTAGRLPMLAPEQMPNISGFAHLFFRALFQRQTERVLLVIDDLQEVGEEGTVLHWCQRSYKRFLLPRGCCC